MKKKANKIDWTKPDFETLKRTERDYMSNYYRISSYMRTEMSNKDMKAHALKWLKKNTKHDLTLIKDLPDWRFETLGRLTCILNNGGEIPETGPAFIERTVAQLQEIAANKEALVVVEVEATPTGPKKNIQDYMREQVSLVAEEVDAYVDALITGETKAAPAVISLMRQHEFKPAHARLMHKGYKPALQELIDVSEKKDDELTEGYRLSKPILKKLITFYTDVLSACDMLVDSQKAAKKPRKKKAVDKNKVVAKVKYQKEDATLSVASISPAEIIGAQEVWVYNTKTRKIGVYVSFDQAGIGVKGTSLTNISSDKSLQKTLRKPALQIKEFKKNTAKTMRSAYDAVKTAEVKLNGRLNETTILLKAFR